MGNRKAANEKEECKKRKEENWKVNKNGENNNFKSVLWAQSISTVCYGHSQYQRFFGGGGQFSTVRVGVPFVERGPIFGPKYPKNRVVMAEYLHIFSPS
jgi:hypothetical protein